MLRPALPVHPRLCGEHDIASIGSFTETGSSPPVRGTPSAACHASRTSSVHPRLCGEHGNICPSIPILPRFIPACAGNTSISASISSASAVHPRLCGEHNGRRSLTNLLWRFIPACAGNTWRLDGRNRLKSVHPRLCGEHGDVSSLDVILNGSSPPVRGTQHHEPVTLCYCRFIPACAGNTAGLPGLPARPSVHPRLCGEHTRHRSRVRTLTGSSPPVRGTHYSVGGEGTRYRFIPACAGNTGIRTGPTTGSSVHPRLCGEHLVMHSGGLNSTGSSPPVRGTRGNLPGNGQP